MAHAADSRDAHIEELERRLKGLRTRLEKLGGEVVRADYKVLHLTQEVRRSREAFDFLTGFQSSISPATSIDVLYRIALKSIISELWMKRAVVLERSEDSDVLKPVEWLGYGPETKPGVLSLRTDKGPAWTKPQMVSSETSQHDWIDAVREALDIPFFVWIPAADGDGIETVLVAGTLAEDAAQEPRLTDDDLDLFVSVGAILWVGRMNLLARERLRRQVIHQSLLHKISLLLLQDVDTPTSHFDDVISQVGTTWSLDRVRLLTRRTDKRMAEVTHEWTARPAASRALEEVQRWRDAMANGETVRIDDVDLLPAAEAGPLRAAGIRSLLLVPIVVHGLVVGWGSFEQCARARVWTPEDVQLLEVIAGLISRAVARETDMEERAQLEAEYHHSRKMEAVGQLAGGVAHDFNNLLTAIQGYAQLLMAKLPAEYVEMPGLREIIMASEKAAVLTRQLLTFSRRDTAKAGPLDLNTVVADTMKLLSRMLGDRIAVETEFSPDLATTFGDAQQISQVIMNLAINARDAMPDGGTLSICTEQFPVRGPLAQRFSIPGIEQAQVLEISDTGCGMDDETKERIFEPFFTTKEAGSGTGLGLSIVFSVVRRHGGFIDVTSRPGKGTTFSIFLPVRTPEEVVRSQEPARDTAAKGHETVLVVEDDETVRTMICDVLESRGYGILAVTNGREALDELAHSPDSISVVMLDVIMPEMGGLEMWNQLNAQGYGIPVIVMSGFPEGKESSDLLKGAATFLEKPFGPNEISLAVRRTLDTAPKSTHEGHGSPLQ